MFHDFIVGILRSAEQKLKFFGSNGVRFRAVPKVGTSLHITKLDNTMRNVKTRGSSLGSSKSSSAAWTIISQHTCSATQRFSSSAAVGQRNVVSAKNNGLHGGIHKLSKKKECDLLLWSTTDFWCVRAKKFGWGPGQHEQRLAESGPTTAAAI